jgi:hypothetical protein
MADNTNEQHLDNLPDTQTESPSTEIVPAIDTDTIHSTHEITNMETHAHHLHNAPGHGWKHYFFEFFMLFLAVFCGLLAENWREHFVDNKREKEYMQTMIEDLRTDTTTLEEQINLGIIVSLKADSLIDFLNSENAVANVLAIYRLNSGRVVQAQLEDRTSSQLKNAGGMRLIRNRKVADALREYWNTNKAMDNITGRMEEFGSKAQTVGSQIFSNKYYIYNDKRAGFFAGVTINPSAQFVNADPKLIAQFSNMRFVSNQILKNYINVLRSEKEAAIKLMKMIEDGYHL